VSQSTSEASGQESGPVQGKQSAALVYAAFVAGLCSIVYELLIATTVSYFQGDSVTWFSLTIGLYMAAMGAGSYCSKFINEQLLRRFLLVETALALVGGLSVPLLYLSYVSESLFMPTYVAMTLAVGFLIGMEIPFLTRLMESFQALKSNIANILTFDYIGALIATLAFPFFLLPVLGNYQSSLVLGTINLSIVLVLMHYFKGSLQGQKGKIKAFMILAFALLLAGIIFSQQALQHWDQSLYSGRIVHAEQTRYQKIVLTREKHDVRLYLNGNIQFSSVDEYRYHESLVLYPMSRIETQVKRVLLLGAGDGLAVKQLLKFPEIEHITLVDLDERVVQLAKTNPYLVELNEGSLQHEKLQLVHSDAFSFLKENSSAFDLIICDLPDPNNLSLARLYSRQFYRLLAQNLSESGALVTQATSPWYSPKAFWSIANTIAASGYQAVHPFHADVPSFGDWGFVLASKSNGVITTEPEPLVQAKYLQAAMLPAMSVFGKDQLYPDAQVNRLDSPILLDYYLEGWHTYGY